MNQKNQNIAIFDLDHTITSKDTYLSFLIHFLKKNPERLLHCWFLPIAVVLHKTKQRDNSWLKETFLTAIAGGTNQHEINEFAHHFTQLILEQYIYQDAVKQIEFHKQQGDLLILASASFDFYVQKMGQQLGFDKILLI